MPSNLAPLAGDLAWPLAIAIASVLGESMCKMMSLPRISVYGLIGFALGKTLIGLLPPSLFLCPADRIHAEH